ncbi:helix-turn-helix domain-containing protein [Amycolatopsis nigrescens]|uniref:helix-turn-helix domain-containing protein n=1 Tax=Amycolatopsis nigrescens TaxID=381445 RepID=UPI000366053A|nr:helix-turn-helix transcriptional regulator [Amycolatopsis nigrescens]
MKDREPTIRSRQLGAGLRKVMHRAGLNGSQAARKLGWVDSTVSRLLNGKRGGDVVEVSAFLAICGVVGEEREYYLQLAREVAKEGWFQQHGSRLPKQLTTLIDHEDLATSIVDFQPMIMPGVLQTAEYARALLMGMGTLPEEEIDGRVAARMARKGLFGRSPQAQFTFFIHEFALMLRVGGNEVMSGQLHQLLRDAVRPYVTLRVIPRTAGVHAGIAGAFMLMEFTDFKPVAYLESQTASIFLEKAEEIAAYRLVLTRLAEKALDEGQSKERIANLAVERYS